MAHARMDAQPTRLQLDLPSPLGLLGFGLTALLIHFNALGFFALDNFILGAGLFYGAAWQVLVGLMEYRRGRPFGAVFFFSFGFFWLSLFSLSLFPHAGIGFAPSATTLAPFLVFWGLFALGLGAYSLILGPVLPVLFGTTAFSLFFQAAGMIFDLPALSPLGSYTGLISSLIALFASLHQVNDLLAGRTPTLFGWARR